MSNCRTGRVDLNIVAIIPNYYGFFDTLICVRSIQQCSQLRKIIIIDNSEDVSETTALRAWLGSYDRVEVLRTGKNLGFGRAVNLAIRAFRRDSNVDSWLILNNDTWVPAASIDELVRAMSEGKYDVVAPRILRYPEINRTWSQGAYYHRLLGTITPFPLRGIPGNLFYLTGCCLLVRDVVFDGAGFLDESFFMYGEDVEWCDRLRRFGYHFGVQRSSFIFHRCSATSHDMSLFYEYHINRSHLLLSRKLFDSDIGRIGGLLIKSIFLLLRSSWRGFRYQTMVPLRGLWLAIRDSGSPCPE